MSGVVRCHVLAAGGALNQRVLSELFYEAANRLVELDHVSLGNLILDRSAFEEDAFHEMQAALASGTNFFVPTHGHLLPVQLLGLFTDDGQYGVDVFWSVKAEVRAANAYMLFIWPVVNDHAYYNLGDLITVDQLFMGDGVTSDNNVLLPVTGGLVAGDEISLGNYGTVSGRPSRGFCGLLALSIAEFSVTECQMQLRRVIR